MEVPSEIMSRYFERRRRDLEACFHSLQGGRFSELEKVGHQLKGNGVTFGYPELSDLGKELEKAAASHDTPSVQKILTHFSTWVEEKVS